MANGGGEGNLDGGLPSGGVPEPATAAGAPDGGTAPAFQADPVGGVTQVPINQPDGGTDAAVARGAQNPNVLTPPPIRVRENVLKLLRQDPNHPIVKFYGQAILEMKKLTIDKPLSWQYQAAIHDYNSTEDPAHTPAAQLPADQGTYWRQCQHGSGFFLPWHRMYIHIFERIIMDHVARLGGPSDWALPYWNYSGSRNLGLSAADSSLFPAAFGNGGLPGLLVSQRDPRANAGTAFATAGQINSQRCLNEPSFLPAAGSSGFGGAVIVHHDPGPGGSLEGTPHGTMHNAVSGDAFTGAAGFMGGFVTAPLDPIFWLHHCNVDRLWEVWLKRDPSHTNPTAAAWLGQGFPFHDATGAGVTMTTSQVLDTKAAPLLYQYDDTGDTMT